MFQQFIKDLDIIHCLVEIAGQDNMRFNLSSVVSETFCVQMNKTFKPSSEIQFWGYTHVNCKQILYQYFICNQMLLKLMVRFSMLTFVYIHI